MIEQENTGTISSSSSLFRGLVAIAVLLIPLAVASCGNRSKQSGASLHRGPRTVPVVTAVAVRQDVPVVVSAVGTVESYETVSVRPQAGGVIDKVYFTEGREVAAGQLLFTIDPRNYQAALDQAAANLARDEVQLAQARKDAQRNQELAVKGYISRQQSEQSSTSVEVLEAAVKADNSAIKNARLMLSYCRITAPTPGKTGLIQIVPGNLVQANDARVLVTINRVAPIAVTFTVPEGYLASIRGALANHALIPVSVVASDGSTVAETGALVFVDNAIDSATGTIRLRAKFPNADRALWPGQFVTVKVFLSTIKDAVVVPSRAIEVGQQGSYLFVIGADHTASLRPVVAGVIFGAMTVVSSGVTAGETVVTDGQVGLTQGAKTEIKTGQGAARNDTKPAVSTSK